MANVNFTVTDLARLYARSTRHVGRRPPTIRDLYRQLENTHRNDREVSAVLDWANELLETHGVEEIDHPGGRNISERAIAIYLNMGDSWMETLLYDTEQHVFLLTSYGDWREWWEREHVESDESDESHDVPSTIVGRLFDVQIWNLEDGPTRPRRVAAQWARVEGRVELFVQLGTNHWVFQRDQNNPVLYSQVQRDDIGWRLTPKALETALVELDLFLESTP